MSAVVYAAMPLEWDAKRFIQAINTMAREKTGQDLFYEEPEQAKQANIDAGADPEKFTIFPTIFED